MNGSFGRYQVLSEIGQGGMGIVYQAIDPDTEQLVAIKHLLVENVDHEKQREFRDRFKREVSTVKRLAHPNIVTIYDVSTEGDNYYYVMEFLDGHNLGQEVQLRGGKLTPSEYWPILRQIIEALSFAHSMNVVHRDVKPDNIFLLANGTVKITDFGIARAADYEQTHLTKTGIMMGTLAYVSPEQLQDAKNVDHRADIFSLGVVSYEILSGQAPFTGEGIAQIVIKIVSQEERPLHIIEPDIGLEISATISKAMRKKARDRYRSIKDFARDYENALLLPHKYNQDSQPSSSYFSESVDGAGDSAGTSRAEAGPCSTTQVGAIIAHPQVNDIGSNNIRMSKPVSIQTPIAQQDHGSIRPSHMITTHGENRSNLIEPVALCHRSNGVVVADSVTREVHLFSVDGRWTGDLKTNQDMKSSKTAGGSLSKPSGIAIDARGRIYICDSSDHFVRIFDSNGMFLRDFRNIQGRDGGLAGIAVDSTGTLFVSDSSQSLIQVFQSELGLWLRSIGKKGDADDQFKLPAGLAIDRLNRIYCADYGSSRIYVFNKNGALIRSFGGRGTGNGLFNVPRNVAVDRNDKVYVLDSLNHRIQVFGPTGDWLYTFGGRGTEPGKFVGPSDLSIDSTNNILYVADKGNHRVQVFELQLT